MGRHSLITGISGQDGVYLARELVRCGRTVHGWGRKDHLETFFGVDAAYRHIDYRDAGQILGALDDLRPSEIYHLASPSCIADTLAFDREIFLMSVEVTQVILRWIVRSSPETRFFFASSSEIFGEPAESPQRESTPPNPQNSYAVAKLAGQQICKIFRNTKGVFASAGILYNHESPLRRPEFVSRRISRGVADVARGRAAGLSLGNLDAFRDWSHAADFACAFRMVLEAEKPDDYILASGRKRTVREFCREAISVAGLKCRVESDPAFYRADSKFPREGDPSKARELLGWHSQIEFSEMVREMVRFDLGETSGPAVR